MTPAPNEKPAKAPQMVIVSRSMVAPKKQKSKPTAMASTPNAMSFMTQA